MTESIKRVIVIGGGVAGLAAGAKLVEKGNFDVILLEAADRIGGRVYSKKFGGSSVEMGAEWIHGQEGNVVFEAVNSIAPNLLNTSSDHDDDKFWSDDSYTYATQYGTRLDRTLNKNITEFLNIMEEDPKKFADDRSLSKYEVAEKYVKEFGLLHSDKLISDAGMNWVERFLNSYDCTDSWGDVSYSGTTLDYIELPGIRNIAWKAPANSNTFLKIILEGSNFSQKSPQILPSWIHLNKEVTNVDYSQEIAIIRCADGSRYSADHVICTIPLGVLKRNHSRLFNPSLYGPKLCAIEILGYGTVNKLYFEFDVAWWPQEFNGVNLLWIEHTKHNNLSHLTRSELLEECDGFPMWCRGLLNFHRVDTHPTALRSWLSGRAARVVETLQDEAVTNICIKVLRQFMGPEYKVPEPKKFMATKWSLNPFAGGTYSFRTLSSERENVWASNIADPVLSPDGKPILCFAGEATDEHFYSSLHGAYASGLREANRLLDFANRTTSSKPNVPN